MKAILLGASGLVGHFLLTELLNDSDYSKIEIFSRSPLGLNSPKVTEHIGDLLSEEFWPDYLEADAVFVCIGTTKAKTSDMETYKAIDFGIPLKAAALSKKGNVKHFSVVSSIGADAQSRNFYLKTKGQMEAAIADLDLPSFYFLRPSMILGPRQEKRFGENIGKIITSKLSFLFPAKYKGVEAADIAKAMWALSKGKKAPQIIESQIIKSTANYDA
ncbi:MAG: hypothetical protein ACJAZH_000432 [Roseivirga sp.]|jgi:uncharacterized protein YbjT (DUF2867 family)